MELKTLGSLAVLWLFSGAALACSPIFYEYRYAAKDGQLVYERWSEDKTVSIEQRLAGVNLAKFHRVLPLDKDPKSWVDGVRYFNDANYFTDNKQVLYNGQVLANSPDLPAIDAKTFRQPFNNFSFAVDKSSIYYQGKRTDDNTGAKRVDLSTLKPVDEHILMDANNLYHAGKFIGVADGYKVLKTQQYVIGSYCSQGLNIIARNRDTLFVNGIAIPGDADSFKIKRWMPDIVLDYSDSLGSHTYGYGKTEQEIVAKLADQKEYVYQGFYPARDKVYYTKSVEPKTFHWQLVDIPGVDPESFSIVNSRVATDGRQLYVLKGKLDGHSPLSLSTITLDSSITQVSEPYVVGLSNVYFINRDGVQIFDLQGKFVPLNDYFAHDDRYIYMFNDPYHHRPVQRFKTKNAQAVRLKEPERIDSDLITQEGIYLFGGEFQPINHSQ